MIRRMDLRHHHINTFAKNSLNVLLCYLLIVIYRRLIHIASTRKVCIYYNIFSLDLQAIVYFFLYTPCHIVQKIQYTFSLNKHISNDFLDKLAKSRYN